VNGLPAPGDAPRLFDDGSLRRTVARLAHEVVERHRDLNGLMLIGIKTRGVPLAVRLADTIGSLGSCRPPVAAVDTRDFRDDSPRPLAAMNHALSSVDGAPIPAVEGATVILVDDVLFTGRTQRAALDAVLAAGRPAAVEMLVLVDRGHRELPLRATYVGKNVPTSSADRVTVRLLEVDGVDGAWLVQGAPA
jgi:pyrimidine operon attenuation protein / uracil phosphoribosyltransferase